MATHQTFLNTGFKRYTTLNLKVTMPRPSALQVGYFTTFEPQFL